MKKYYLPLFRQKNFTKKEKDDLRRSLELYKKILYIITGYIIIAVPLLIYIWPYSNNKIFDNTWQSSIFSLLFVITPLSIIFLIATYAMVKVTDKTIKNYKKVDELIGIVDEIFYTGRGGRPRMRIGDHNYLFLKPKDEKWIEEGMCVKYRFLVGRINFYLSVEPYDVEKFKKENEAEIKRLTDENV